MALHAEQTSNSDGFSPCLFSSRFVALHSDSTAWPGARRLWLWRAPRSGCAAQNWPAFSCAACGSAARADWSDPAHRASGQSERSGAPGWSIWPSARRLMDREGYCFLGGLIEVAQEGFLSLRSFAQLRTACRELSAPDWLRAAAFQSSRRVWLQQRLWQVADYRLRRGDVLPLGR